MSDKTSCEIFIAINEDGGYAVGMDEEEASTRLQENEGGYMCRIVKIVAKIAPPTISKASIDVPDEVGQTTEVETAE